MAGSASAWSTRGALEESLLLLRQFVADQGTDQEHLLEDGGADLEQLLRAGSSLELAGGGGGAVVVADLCDPLLEPDQASNVFAVLLEQFRAAETGCGKLLVADDAHKYLGDCSERGGRGGPLARGLVDAARMMRHEGMRIVVAAESPLSLPPELLELCSATVCHRFHSPDWCTSLATPLPWPMWHLCCTHVARAQVHPNESLPLMWLHRRRAGGQAAVTSRIQPAHKLLARAG